MIPKSPTPILGGLLAVVLIALSLAGCQKEEALEPQLHNDAYNDDLNFRAGTGACDPGVTLLEMYNEGGNDNVVRWYNNSNEDDGSFKQEQDIMDAPYPTSLLQFSANAGYAVHIQNQQMGVKTDGPGSAGGQWITPGEILYIKVGTDLTPDGWRFLTGSLYLEHQANTTVRIQMRSNGQNVQPAIVKTHTTTGFERYSLSLFYHWDEVAISVDGATGGVNVPLKAAQAERQCFIITNNTNHFIALRQRAGLYFWNSMVDNDHAGIFKPNHQYLDPATGNFGLTSLSKEWMADAATPAYINRHKAGGAFGPANPLSPGTDYSVNAGEEMTLKIGADPGAGFAFINAIIPIWIPSTGGSPLITLRSGGSDLATIPITQIPGTRKYHLLGVFGITFDEIRFECTSGRYEVFTDYWSVNRFSMCDASMEKPFME